MSGDAEVNMALYMDLREQEERALKGIEGDVLKLMFDNGITARPIWTSRTGADSRFVQLCVPGSPQLEILFELAEGEFVSLSAGELVSRLQDSIEFRGRIP